ncbi:MAG TPA: CehA/McbA family metallohydrolase [Planctomycetota bacterium]|nr:CehA/McbA family metallohydrolase [Planctomycetota bacterium]
MTLLAALLLLLQDPVDVEGQPLAVLVDRVVQAYDYLGHPLPPELKQSLKDAGTDARRIQELLRPRVVLDVSLQEPVALRRGAGPASLQQAGFTPLLLRIVNEKGARSALRIGSPQSGPVYAGVAELSMERQNQRPLRENENIKGEPRFLQVDLFQSPPLARSLSGLRVEYLLLLVYSSEAGRRPATIEVEGTAIPIEFDVAPAIPLRLTVRDVDGAPTTARLTFTDRQGHVYPPQPKRLAPDFFFQKQIYRHDGETVLLPPGEFKVTYSRGPEYLAIERDVTVPKTGEASLALDLRRWIHPQQHGYYGGDHHIHAAGCAHYSKPSEGVNASDMFRQVKGEGLNVGCILTWGYCYEYQRQFFLPTVDKLSEPLTLLKYDVEVSGFGSQSLGHVCLLNLKDQSYPGSDGIKKWPTWTTPVLKWAKQQGALTGYAHSASGLQPVPLQAARRLLAELDRNRDGKLDAGEASRGLLPEDFAQADADGDGALTEAELERSVNRAVDRLPNVAIPEMNSVGAMEIFVTVAQGICDFISAMDTERLPEWNCWYHLMNCGFPLKVSGETDFPCMSGTRVGQGRVYVQLGKVDKVDFTAWCDGLARGRSYVSDGYAHAPVFNVDGKTAGGELAMETGGTVQVQARVAFASQTPLEVPYGGMLPLEGPRVIGDTRILHQGADVKRESRKVELVINGQAVASKDVPADDRDHEVVFLVPVEKSSWIAVRQFPQLHTNPVAVIVAGKPIRASRKSALWAIGCIDQLWRARGKSIAESEREEAKKTFDWAIEQYRKIAAECPEGS